MIDANSFEIKKVLSFLRYGDFAHPGEKDAIDLAFKNIPKLQKQLLLDVGCGLGGTADYIEAQNFGKVIGIDIDKDAINYAQNTYQNIDFLCVDVIDAAKNVNFKFDVIYMFNAFYAFPEQNIALRELRKLAKPGCQLIIFDYVRIGEFNQRLLRRKPIKLANIEQDLNAAAWKLNRIISLNDEYQKWYCEFVQRIISNKEEIIKKFGIASFDYVYVTYSQLLADLETKQLGGAIIYAVVG